MMSRLILCVIGIATLTAMGAGLRSDPPVVRPCVQWVGRDSKVDRQSYQLIRDEAAWQKLWESHAGKSDFRYAVPRIDFTQCAVVAFFRGRTSNEDGEILHAILANPDRVVLRFESCNYQTQESPESTTPFGIWVIPATNLSIVLEQGWCAGLGQPISRWDPVHRFEALR